MHIRCMFATATIAELVAANLIMDLLKRMVIVAAKFMHPDAIVDE